MVTDIGTNRIAPHVMIKRRGKMFIRSKKQRGFTLVELLITISIIGVLLALSLASISGARMRSRDAKRIADLRTIQSALEQHVLGDASRSYPPDFLASDAEVGSYCTKYSDPTSPTKIKGIYNNKCFEDYLQSVPVTPEGNQYQYDKPACFSADAQAVGGVVMTRYQGTCANQILRSSAYGLHVVLESANNKEGGNEIGL